ncbi:hypothetical protein HC928_12745 [bacterium]|nr:hypothetical protein [bacterium]
MMTEQVVSPINANKYWLIFVFKQQEFLSKLFVALLYAKMVAGVCWEKDSAMASRQMLIFKELLKVKKRARS